MIRLLSLLFFLFILFKTDAQPVNISQTIDFELLKGIYVKVINLTDSCLNSKFDVQFQYKNALAHRLNYNYNIALEKSTALLESEPKNIDFLLEQSRNLINQDQFSDATDTLISIFYNLDTLNTNAGILLGKIYEHYDNWTKAVDVYYRLSNINPENTYFLYHQAIALTNIKKGKHAIPLLEKALNIEPEHINCRYLLFRIYKALGEYEIAVRQIDTIKTITPNNYKPYYELGMFNYAKNYNYKALPEFQRAVELGYPDDDASHFVGKCYLNIKKYNEAIPYLKYTTSQVEDFNLCQLIAQCYENLDINDSALIYYDKAYALAMPDPSMLENYYDFKAKNSIKIGDYEDAIHQYSKFITQVEKLRWEGFYKMQTQDKIADIYINRLNNKAKAIELYSNAFTQQTDPNSGLSKYYKQKINELNEEIFFNGELK